MTDAEIDEDKPSQTAGLKDTLSLREAGLVMRLGVNALRGLIATGQIPALTLNEKHWVLLRKDVLEFIDVNARIQQEARKRVHTRGIVAALPVELRGRGRPRRPIPDLD